MWYCYLIFFLSEYFRTISQIITFGPIFVTDKHYSKPKANKTCQLKNFMYILKTDQLLLKAVLLNIFFSPWGRGDNTNVSETANKRWKDETNPTDFHVWSFKEIFLAYIILKPHLVQNVIKFITKPRSTQNSLSNNFFRDSLSWPDNFWHTAFFFLNQCRYIKT